MLALERCLRCSQISRRLLDLRAKCLVVQRRQNVTCLDIGIEVDADAFDLAGELRADLNGDEWAHGA